MKKINLILVAAVSSALLAACGGGSSGTASTSTGTSVAASARLLGTVALPGITPTTKFTYDGGQVVDADGRFYLTDRNAKGVDVIDTKYLTVVGQATGSGATAFTGQAVNPDGTANNNQTGPNSLQKIPGTSKLYVTDVNSVKVVDTNTLQVIKVIPINDATGKPTGNRTDGSCLDAVHHIFMAMNSADNFITWINTDTDTVMTRYDYDPAGGTAGLEVCAYVPSLGKFYVNNDGTNAHPDGELDSFPIASVLAKAPVLLDQINLPGCFPNGLAVGPNNEAVIGCDAYGSTEGQPFITYIADLKTGTLFPAIKFGGSDLVSYDPVTNRYFLGSRNWQTGGKYAAALPKNPSLGIIDAATHQALPPVPAGSGAHTAVVDSANARVYVPYTPTSGSTDFANGGIAVYSTN